MSSEIVKKRKRPVQNQGELTIEEFTMLKHMAYQVFGITEIDARNMAFMDLLLGEGRVGVSTKGILRSLCNRGLAMCTGRSLRDKRQNVYMITDKGIRALLDWRAQS